MNDYGFKLFNLYGPNATKTPNVIKHISRDGFLILQTADESTGSKIDQAFSNNGIVFDAAGNVWDAALKQPIWTNNFFGHVDPTTLTWDITYNNQILPLEGINASLTGIKEAEYWVSLPDNSSNLGGFLLFRVVPTASGVPNFYHLLLNPFNRENLVNQDNPNDLYQLYCNAISLQDPNCYCLSNNLTPNPNISPNGSGNYCFFSSLDTDKLNGRTLAIDLEDNAGSYNNLQVAGEINTLKNGCNCLGTCKSVSSNNFNNPLWSDFSKLFQTGTSCSSVQNLSLVSCLSQISGGGDVDISGNSLMQCASNSTPTTPTTPTSSSKSFKLGYLIIALIVFIIIGGIFLLHKTTPKTSFRRKK
jgi:hypothetical protein